MSREVSKPLLATVILLFIATFVALIFVQTNVPISNVVTNISGNITVTVNASMSVVLLDSGINFGTCNMNQTRGYSYFDSSKANTSSVGCDNFQCTGIYLGSNDYLNLSNDGNVDINVTLKTNSTAGNIFKDGLSATNSYYQYKSANSGLGCDWTTGNQPFTYVNFSAANVEHQLCDNMTYDDGSDSFEIYAAIWINASSESGGQATWTFTANAI